jgi:microcystin-dependent protein
MDAFIGEIRPFAFGWAPADWLLCDGAKYPVSQYQPLFSIVGNIYGGDLRTYFNVPNLQGLSMVGIGVPSNGAGAQQIVLGKAGGVESVAITSNNMPPHNHTFMGKLKAGNARTTVPDNTSFVSNYNYTPPSGASSAPLGYSPYSGSLTNQSTLNSNALSPFVNPTVMAHDNLSPYLTIAYYICYQNGEYPVRP